VASSILGHFVKTKTEEKENPVSKGFWKHTALDTVAAESEQTVSLSPVCFLTLCLLGFR
jgi:hypothetical protein